jgi:murein DD-endopeptidase MepM/ murein hydrolase activator NlpD
MIVPHGTARPRQITFTASFALFLFVFWTGFTAWAGYVASQRFDYWRAKANTHLMKIKVDYFANQLKRSHESLDQVKVMEHQLRTLLGMGSREAIIQSANDPLGTGGPSLLDATLLGNALDGRVAAPRLEDVSLQVRGLKQEIEKRLTSFHEVSGKIEEDRRVFRYTPRGWPANGYLTSSYGTRIHPLSGLPEYHDGLDIAGPHGTPIRATADGVVQLAGWASGYGKVVVIDHLYGFTTRFGHNRQILVRRGDKVKRGQVLALMGETGSATGSHCHYEVRQKGRAVNPRPYLGPADF